MKETSIDFEREARRLFTAGLVNDLDAGIALLKEQQLRIQRADTVIIYHDVHNVKSQIPQAIYSAEQAYNGTNLRVAPIASGYLGKIMRAAKDMPRPLAMARVMEYIPKSDRNVARLAARIDEFPFGGEKGVYLSPFSANEIHTKGKQTFDERMGFFRIEFKPIMGDYALGMFEAWNNHPINEKGSLVLCISRDRTITL